jgi:hypothetical protein
VIEKLNIGLGFRDYSLEEYSQLVGPPLLLKQLAAFLYYAIFILINLIGMQVDKYIKYD